MMQPPVLVRSVLTPRRRWTVLGAGAGAIIYFGLAGLAESEPAAQPTVAALDLAPLIAGSRTARIEPPAPRRYGPDAFAIEMAPVFADGGLRVLLRSEVRERWLGGPPELTTEDGMTVVTRKLSRAGRTEVAAATGARLRLYRTDGRSCLARVTGAVALGRLDDGGNLDPEAGAQGAWDVAVNWHVVAGNLEPLEGSCDDALWARSESLPPPTMADAGKPSDSVKRDAIAALKKRAEYRALADDSGLENEEFEVETLSTGAETVVVTTLLSEGCAGQWPTLIAMWQLGNDGTLRFLGAEDSITAILGGADTDGDGRIEIVAQDDLAGLALLRRGSGRFRVGQRAPVGILGCRC